MLVHADPRCFKGLRRTSRTVGPTAVRPADPFPVRAPARPPARIPVGIHSAARGRIFARRLPGPSRSAATPPRGSPQHPAFPQQSATSQLRSRSDAGNRRFAGGRVRSLPRLGSHRGRRPSRRAGAAARFGAMRRLPPLQDSHVRARFRRPQFGGRVALDPAPVRSRGFWATNRQRWRLLEPQSVCLSEGLRLRAC